MTSYLWGAANLTKKALWDAPVWAVSTTSSGLVGAARYAYAPLQNASASAISGAASRLTEEQDSIKQVVKGILGNAALEMAHNNLLCLAQSAASLYDLENLSSGKIKILKKDLKDIITNPTTFGREKWNTPEEKVPLEKLLAELEKLVLPDDSSAEQDIVIPNEVKATLPEAVDLLGSLVKENTGIFHHYLDFFKVTVDKEMAQAALPLLQAKEHLYPLLATNARPAKKQIEDMVDHLKKLEILDHTTLGSDWSTNDKTHLVKFIYYFENTLLPLYDDSGLKEPDKQQVRVLLTDLLEPFIAHSQGTLMRALGLFKLLSIILNKDSSFKPLAPRIKNY